MPHCSWRRWTGRLRRAGWLGGVASVVLVGAAGPPVGAVVGGSASAVAVDVALAVDLDPLVIDVSGGTPALAAPAANGTNASGSSATLVGDLASAAVSAAVVDAGATRGPLSMSAFATVDRTEITLLGAELVTVAGVSSAVECPLLGAPTASATATDVTIGAGPAVSLSSSGTISTSGTAIVTDPGFVDGTATVDVTATAPALAGAGTATATGLRLTLSFSSGTSVADGADLTGLSIGSLVLAEAVCEVPTAADPVASDPDSILPAIGSTLDPTATTITGSGFTGATGVTFDGVAGIDFVVVDDSTITVSTPPGAAGPADVVVTDPVGDGPLPAAFTYVAPFDYSLVAPDEGPTTGGTRITITGSGFTGVTAVTFGGSAGTALTVDDSTIMVTTPTGELGPVDIVLTGPLGDAPIHGGFTYRPVGSSTILGIDPVMGPGAGGTTTTITGFGFLGATGVTFDGIGATSFSVLDDTTIAATTPARSAQHPVDVVVLDPLGDGILYSGFTYVNPVVATSITPADGPTAGGTWVTITGSGFLGATTVTFDGVAGTGLEVFDDSTIQVASPPGAPGPAEVVVTSTAGDATVSGGFTYLSPSAVQAILPSEGPAAGGTATTITGAGFLGATDVTFDGVVGTGFVVVDDTTITVTTPAGTLGPADVVVIDPAGDGSSPAGFTYVAAPMPMTISPATGPTSGGVVTTVRGTGFTGATAVSFGGIAGTDLVVVDDTTLTVTTPAGPEGFADVIVTGPAGTGVLRERFTYVAPSVVSAITPAVGPTSGGTPTTITGTGFVGASGATFDGVAGTDFVVVSSTVITVTTPPGDAGPADVVVLDPAGNGSLVAGLSYVAAASGATVMPPTGIDPWTSVAARTTTALPHTGTDPWTSLAVATGALLAGLLASRLGRRRRTGGRA